MKMKNDKLKNFLNIIVPFILCSLIYIIVFRCWEGSINIPIAYMGRDDFCHAMWIKAALNSSSYWEYPLLGFPYSQTMYNFNLIPMGAILLAKLLKLFTQDYAVVLNIYYFLSYIGAMYTFMYACKKFNIKYSLSVFGGILFAFCQYHFCRSIMHLTATNYMAVPLVIILCYYIFFGKFEVNRKFYLEVLSICIVTACLDTFYAFFGCFLLLICTFIACIHKNKKSCILGIASVSLISFFTLCIQLPSIWYKLNTNGLEKVTRSAYDSFHWGLKLITLAIPNKDGHPLSFLKDSYIAANIPSGENLWNYLGVGGLVGLFVLVFYFLKNQSSKSKKEEVGYFLSVQTIFIILLGLSGGLGLIVALLISPLVRTYCRTFVYIYFFSIMGLLLLIDNKYYNKLKKYYKVLFLTILLIFHLIDIQAFAFVPNYAVNEAKFKEDQEFIERIENEIGSEAAILQLPYVDFPENSTIVKNNYLRGIMGYLHSDSLRWSSGLVSGTPESEEAKNKYDTDDLNWIIWSALEDGYDAIYVDSNLLEDKEEYLTKLNEILNTTPITNDSKTLYCYPIDYDMIDNISTIKLGAGFYSRENSKNGTYWNWSCENSLLYIAGQGKVKISFDINSLDTENAIVQLKGAGIEENLKIDNKLSHYEVELEVDGVQEIAFTSTARTIKSKKDSRELNFALYNYSIETLEEDQEFIERIENEIGSEAAILQLPYVDFPENSTIVHSDSLRWSDELVSGTPESEEAKNKYDTDDLNWIIWSALEDGYDAIYVDSKLLEDKEEYLTKLNEILNTTPITNDSKTLYCYPIDYDMIDNISTIKLGAGFYSRENSKNGTYWNWSCENSLLYIAGQGKVKISFDINSLDTENAIVQLKGAGIEENLKIDNKLSHYEVEIEVDGVQEIAFTSTARTIKPKKDSRELNFALYNYSIETLESGK